MKYPQKLALVVALLLTMWPTNANAQDDGKLASPEKNFRAAISAQMGIAARDAHVSVSDGMIAYAGGDGGFIVNTAIQGAEQFGSDKAGTDILFVYVGVSGYAVAPGYYKVRLVGNQAQFITRSGKVSATLPADVNLGGSKIAAAKPKVKLTAKWGKDGPEIDIEVTFGESAKVVRSAEILIQPNR